MSEEKNPSDELPASNIDSTKKGLSTEEKLALFEKVNEAYAEVEELEGALLEAKGVVSDAIQEVFEHCGKGPFRLKTGAYAGKDITIVARKAKGQDRSTYYFREQPAEVEEIG